MWIELTCAKCNKKFTIWATYAQQYAKKSGSDARYCSRSCAGIVNNSKRSK